MLYNITSYINNMDKNSKFLLIVIIIISILLILIFLLNYLGDSKNRKMNKKKKKLIKEINLEAKNVIIPKTNKVNNISNIKIDKNKEEVKDENLEEIIDEDVEVLDEDNDIDRIISDINNSSISNIDLNEFEREQEETAIISYDELCKKAGVEKKIYSKYDNENKEDKSNSNSKYKPSKIISPIYGIQK